MQEGPPPPAPLTPPVVVVEKKRRLGCLGCGCGALVLILLVLLALGAMGFYSFAQKGKSLTSVTAPTVPSFDGGDAMYRDALQKWNDFMGAVEKSQPAKLELNADEINTLLARDSNLSANQVHIFVAFPGDQADLQVSAPTGFLPLGVFQGRYADMEVDFTPDFDATAHSLGFTLHKLRLGSSAIPPDNLGNMQQMLDVLVPSLLEQWPDGKQILDHASVFAIANGELTIQTQ